jgi:uncharacterized protein (DUF433 family)
MTIATNSHIVIDNEGRTRIASAWFKVRMLVEFVQGGMTIDQLKENFPQLSMAEIHSALAYYYDHKQGMDADIQTGLELSEKLRAEAIALS